MSCIFCRNSFWNGIRKLLKTASIRFSTGSVEERINMSIDVSENTMEYFLKNVNNVKNVKTCKKNVKNVKYVIVF